jgi:hypothetical protein
MARPHLRPLLAIVLTIGVLLPSAAPAALAASPRQAPPPGINAARPTVTGKLVAKATGKSSPGPVSCGASTAAPTVMLHRGLVICTDDGSLVLLQLSPPTRFFNRDWQGIGYARLALGDRLDAWGTVRDGGTRLDPTVAVQDLSRGGVRLQSVTGKLVAKPGQAPTGRVVCADRDVTGDAQTAVSRGLVVCTEEGTLVLLQISSTTKLLTRDRARVTIEDLRLGDLVTGTGTLQESGSVMNPTRSVLDADLLRAGTNSQDFIAGTGSVLNLFVLSSEPGPVQGRVRASPGEPTHVTLCSGVQGAWSDLKTGLTVDVSQSVFNTRAMEYVDTGNVTVVSCR